IEGDGFFQIQLPDGAGTAYTRDGSFKFDNNRQIVTSEGYPLMPGFTVSQNAVQVTVAPNGTVSETVPGATGPIVNVLGQVELARFVNPAGLSAMGQNLFQVTAASGAANTNNPGTDGMGTIQSGYLEMSNVNMVEEMVNMIASQRAYEVSSKGIRTSDEMLQQAANLKR
ncbi:MAG: flagellar hook-basal body complex protein, partial [Magnetococcales bacterium]|nr:flagellar hook-basal body complex protein [Magnetococcales bacterium]